MSSHPLTRADDALNHFASTLAAVSYGVAFTLYCICARLLYLRLRKPAHRRTSLTALAYTSLAMICGTGYLVFSQYIIQMAYVFNRDYPGGPVAYETEILYHRPPFASCLLMMVILDWLTLGIQLWRLCIIWSTTPYFFAGIALPALLFVSTVAFGIAAMTVQYKADFLSPPVARIITIVFFGLPPVMTVLVTTLAISRLVLIRKRHISIMGRSEISGHYMGVVAMLIECYALDAAWSICMIVSYAVIRPLVYVIFVQSSVNIKTIALLLIVYQVAKGRALQSHVEHQPSNMRWDYSAGPATSSDVMTVEPPSRA